MSNPACKVLYISHSAHLYGAERSLLQLLVGLDRTRFSPVVVLPHDGPLQKHIERLDIPVEIVPSLRPWSTRRTGVLGLMYFLAILPFILASVLAIRRLIRRYEIRLVHSNTMVVVDGALAARSLGIPHVWHARAILTGDVPHHFILGPKMVMAMVLALSERVIAISQAVAECFGGMPGSEKIKVVYNAIDIDAFAQSEARATYRQLLGAPGDVPLVGQVANVTAVKGYTDFIRAIPKVRKMMPEVRFVGVGGTPHADYKAITTRLMSELSLGDSLILTGFREDIPQIVAALDIFVLASHYEPFGRVLVEAMAAGKPVIGTNVGGIPEIIEDGVTGLLVPPHAPDDLAQAIIKILQDPDLARRLGAAGRERAKACFSPERYVTEVQKVYEGLLGEEPTAGC